MVNIWVCTTDAQTVIGFLKTYNLDGDFKVSNCLYFLLLV